MNHLEQIIIYKTYTEAQKRAIKKYALNNKEKIYESQKRYREKEKEKINERRREIRRLKKENLEKQILENES